MGNRISVRTWPEKGVIFLAGVIDWMAPALVERSIARIKEGGAKTLYFIINEEGGDDYAKSRIAAVLRGYKGNLVTVIYGKAFSGGFYLSQLGKLRLATRKSKMGFHRARWIFKKEEQRGAAELGSILQELLILDAMQREFFSKRIHPIRKLAELFKSEKIFGAKLAKSIHAIDRIIPEPKSVEDLIKFLRSHKHLDAFEAALEEISDLY